MLLSRSGMPSSLRGLNEILAKIDCRCRSCAELEVKQTLSRDISSFARSSVVQIIFACLVPKHGLFQWPAHGLRRRAESQITTTVESAGALHRPLRPPGAMCSTFRSVSSYSDDMSPVC